jgi:hypothetical protein
VLSRFFLLLSSLRKKNTSFSSYAKPLIELCKTISPGMILEFGPGLSTKIFIKHTNSFIISIEQNESWYRKYKNAFPKDRVKLLLLPNGVESNAVENLLHDYTLIFIDGGDRLKALAFGYNQLSKDGVAYLHDAHREEYETGIRRYPYIFFPERHSCILSRDQETYSTIRQRIPINYSCSCQYCSSPSRRTYFEQFSEKLP